jgi:sirohydrochlorin cobaltochelatase
MTDDFDALLIIGHGTREPAGLAEFRSVVEAVQKQHADWNVEGCFLELAEPSIAAAIDRLAARGLSRIRALPLMLFSAGHAKRDIPEALAEAIVRNPGLEIELCPALGCHWAIVELSAERCRQALLGQPPVPLNETMLILVGRGSSDLAAIAEMRRLADLRQAGGAPHGEAPNHGSLFGRIEVGFAAVATPSLSTVLAEAAQSDFRRVIVQPHLLFAGSVLADIRRGVDERRSAEPAGRRQWIVSDPLGPDALLVTAITEVVSRAISTDPLPAA